jgi:hypothetical protein
MPENALNPLWGPRRVLPEPLRRVARPWDHQPGESRQAFAAFTIYLKLPGPRRSAAAAARFLGRSYALMARWRRRWQWTARAKAWDMERLRNWEWEGRALETQARLAEITGGPEAARFRAEQAAVRARRRRLVCAGCPFVTADR